MCGIAGYTGTKNGLPIVLNSLRRLEYRGYDSAGVVFGANGRLRVIKTVGKLGALESALGGMVADIGTAVIGHTRWATHGAPTKENAHPHGSCDGKIFVVHNGIIENYRELKESLQRKGHVFTSETDTEVVAHLIEERLKREKNIERAFDAALTEIRGAYALAMVHAGEPGTIYFARFGSPLVLGLGKEEFFLASDPTALAGVAREVVYLKDGQRGKLMSKGYAVRPSKPKIEFLDIDPETVKKGAYSHFMLKEIFEGPEVVAAAMRGRLNAVTGAVKLGGLEQVASELRKKSALEIIACGTSYNAGMVGELLFEEFFGVPTETALASEYRYKNDAPMKNAAYLFISQSGETADTLAALRKANARKCLTLGLVNVVGSSIARETVAGVYNHAGPEIGVASTKAFLSQLTVLTLMALMLGKKTVAAKRLAAELGKIPKKIGSVLGDANKIMHLAKRYASYKDFFYLGRGYNYPVALEGALKLKEISYVHAEGYAGGEMKHGPIALIDEQFPTVAVVTKNALYEKMVSNIEEIKARRGKVIAIATVGDTMIRKLADDVIYVPPTLPQLEPMVNVVPMQLFAYAVGVGKGYNVDTPRNLAKSVTVE